MRCLIVDPGIRGCGAAIFNGDVLEYAAYVRNSYGSDNGPVECVGMAHALRHWWAVRIESTGYSNLPGELIVEWPRVYTAGKQKGDPNDLPPLVGVDCALAAFMFPVRVTRYFPEQWKGQTEKEVMNARVLARLSDEEKSRVENAGALTHNVLDAVGIGLHHVGRLKRRRVFPR